MEWSWKFIFLWGFILLSLRITHQAANVALGGEAVQSSFWEPLYSSNVVIDGSTSSSYLSGSCVSTWWEVNPWWRLDLRGPYDISSIEVMRRTDCCIHELEGAEIRIGDSLENNGNNNPRCAVITVTSDVIMTFNCSQMTGRYVNIVLPGVSKLLQLCEVKVYATANIIGANVAPRGTAMLSAETASNVTAPHMAIDLYPGDPQETCASVLLQDDPWWQLDLMSIYHITAVSVISVEGCCSGELNGAEIRIGLKNDTSNERCAIISTAEGQRKYSYQCGIMIGRFVHIVLPGLQKNLTICDVRVYGTVLENVALRGVAFQSSSRWTTTGYASRVIDSHRFSTCSVTKNKPSQWVTVDLLVPYNVTVIQLAYNGNCCYSDEVRVDDTSCQVNSLTSNYLVTVDCGGILGRYVTVIHPVIPPPLCEVEVYSTLENPQNKVPQRPPSHDYCYRCHRDYVHIQKEPKTWFEAQAYCREWYTDLATIDNVQDMNRVIDKMGDEFHDFWIGLYEDVVTWRWSLLDEGYYGDGEAEFRNWDAVESNDTSGIQHCAGIQHTGEWKDLDCDLPHYFLCFDGNGAPQTKILVETPMNWTDAQRYCREHHTDLLSVRNQTENQEIQSMVPVGKLAWIGLFGDSWRWSDGSNSSFRFQWQEPADSLGEGPNCVHVYDRKWSVRACDTKSMFLCYDFKKKRSVVKIRTDFDMSDPVIQQQIMSQLGAEMTNKGISYFKIRWRTSFTQETNSVVHATSGR